MILRYSSEKLKRECEDERAMQKAHGDVIKRTLMTRIKFLERCTEIEELRKLDPLGRWHPLRENRAGQWAGKLSGNKRLIVNPSQGVSHNETEVVIVEIVDYHN